MTRIMADKLRNGGPCAVFLSGNTILKYNGNGAAFAENQVYKRMPYMINFFHHSIFINEKEF